MTEAGGAVSALLGVGQRGQQHRRENRDQSVALKMVCERQAEIDAFQPVEYWVLGARLAAPAGRTPPEFVAKLHQIDGKKAEVGSAQAAETVRRELAGGDFRVTAIERNAELAPDASLFMLAEVYEDFGLLGERDAALAQLK